MSEGASLAAGQLSSQRFGFLVPAVVRLMSGGACVEEQERACSDRGGFEGSKEGAAIRQEREAFNEARCLLILQSAWTRSSHTMELPT